MSKKAILVVSFGTSFMETRKKTIDCIEDDIQKAYPDCQVYRAWTSKMIIRKLKIRDGIIIPTVTEALTQMKDDSVTDVIVQPTHILNGIENDIMKEEILAEASNFSSLCFGDPLLTTTSDILSVIKTTVADYSNLPDDEAVVLMGHGTNHHVNTVYAAMDYSCKDLGYAKVFIGTVEAYPSLENIIRQLRFLSVTKVHLAPFMVVAGDHAINDMAGNDEDSWKAQLERAGYTVTCHLKGLGEYEGVRRLYLEHLEKCFHE